MAEMTLNAAIGEMKTLKDREQKAREFIRLHSGRDVQFADPLAHKEGGSVGELKRKRQQLKDWQTRRVNIHTKVQEANHKVTITLEGEEHSIAWWLNWRNDVTQNSRIGKNNPEVYQGEPLFLGGLQAHLAQARQRVLQARQQRGGMQVEPPPQGDYISHIDEAALGEEIDRLTNILGQLDAKLTSVNETTKIEV